MFNADLKGNHNSMHRIPEAARNTVYFHRVVPLSAGAGLYLSHIFRGNDII